MACSSHEDPISSVGWIPLWIMSTHIIRAPTIQRLEMSLDFS